MARRAYADRLTAAPGAMVRPAVDALRAPGFAGADVLAIAEVAASPRT